MNKKHSPSSNPKIQQILNHGLTLLRDHGDHGLTMRQVAVNAGMSLSNVQYYFRTKNDLLKGMVDYYFQKCENEFDAKMDSSESDDVRKNIYKLISINLFHGEALTEMCKIFREFWAIATRNKEINDHLLSYYSRYAERLSEEIELLSVDPDFIPQAIGLLLPYFEGYSITAKSLPLNADKVANMLTDITMSVLEGTIRKDSSSV